MTTWADLSIEQQANAALIVAGAQHLGADTWDCIATVMCAMQESSLINLPGGDKDSIGLFQQRPSQGWGTSEQCADPLHATAAFLTGAQMPGLDRWLMKLTDRQAQGYGPSIQWVQRSAFPDAYAKWESLAVEALNMLAVAPDVPAPEPVPEPVPEPPAPEPDPEPPAPPPQPTPKPPAPPPVKAPPQEQPMALVSTGLPWIPAAEYGGKFRAPPPRQVVIHSTETPLQAGIAASLARNWFGTSAAGTSAHDMFDPAAGVEMVHTDTIAWHCGTGNSTSVGIEHAGRASFSKAEWSTPAALAMLRQSAQLSAKICKAYDIPARWLSIAQLAANEKGLCFVAGTLILTQRGLIPVEEVQVGDKVWTHRDRWRPVYSTMHREADVVKLKGQGHPGLTVTPEHPFLARTLQQKTVKDESTPSGRNMILTAGAPAWVEAKDMVGRAWLTPVLDGTQEPPSVDGLKLTPEQMWVVGRWVADGNIAETSKIVFSVGAHKRQEFGDRVEAAGFEIGYEGLGENCTQPRINSRALVDWLKEHFGYLAHGKKLPTWLLTCHEKYRQQFLDGYLSGDGYLMTTGQNEAMTVSRELAFGLKLLGASLGYGVSLYTGPNHGGVIHGRAIQSRFPVWRVRFQTLGARCSFKQVGSHIVGRVKSLEPAGRATVFNLSVEEDESYIADGTIVHNCTHNDMRLARGGTSHTDPGPNFPYTQYLTYLKQYLSGGAPSEDWFDQMDEQTFDRKVAALRSDIAELASKETRDNQTGNILETFGDRADKFLKGQDSDRSLAMGRLSRFFTACAEQANAGSDATALAAAMVAYMQGPDGKALRDALANNVWNTFGEATTDVPHKLRRTDAYIRRVTREEISAVLDEKLAAVVEQLKSPTGEN